MTQTRLIVTREKRVDEASERSAHASAFPLSSLRLSVKLANYDSNGAHLSSDGAIVISADGEELVSLDLRYDDAAKVVREAANPT